MQRPFLFQGIRFHVFQSRSQPTSQARAILLRKSDSMEICSFRNPFPALKRCTTSCPVSSPWECSVCCMWLSCSIHRACETLDSGSRVDGPASALERPCCGHAAACETPRSGDASSSSVDRIPAMEGERTASAPRCFAHRVIVRAAVIPSSLRLALLALRHVGAEPELA